jgi:hypothetical protein
VTVLIAHSSSPMVIHVTSPGPSWLTTIVTVLIGAAAALAAQWVVQVHLVPTVETRKRREDRWERFVLDLGDLLTTQLAERANEAHVEQGLFRDLRELETEPGYDQRKITESGVRQARVAREATRAFESLLSTRINWLARRIEKIAPEASEIADFHKTASKYRARTLIVQVPPEYDDRTEAAFDEQWENEHAAREALIKQVELLADLPHPPHSSPVRRWRHAINRSETIR